MRQGIRFLVKPRAFFNQLQWSSHHWLILLSFLGLATLEAQIGNQHALYRELADVLVARAGVSLGFAAWLITVARLTLLLWAAFSLASVVFLVGNLFGKQTSRRVFFRRIAVVFTVALAAYTAHHGAGFAPWLELLSTALFAWALVLGYFALREQFALNNAETLVLGVFALLLVVSSWHLTNHVLEAAARTQWSGSVANRPVPAAHVRRPRAR